MKPFGAARNRNRRTDASHLWQMRFCVLTTCAFTAGAIQADVSASAGSTSGAAEIPQYVSRVWKTDDGLPQISVRAIAQTRDGYLWFGTFEGLARFDGLRFTQWEAMPPEIKTRTFSALCGATDGSLWMGTAGGGVIHLRGGELLHYTHLNGLAGDDIRDICEDAEGVIWISTNDGLSRFQNGHFTSFTRKDGLNHKVVRGTFCDNHGRVWVIAGDAGLNRFDNGRIVNPFPNQNILPNNSVRAMCQGSDGSFWIGGDRGLVNEKDGRRVLYNKTNGLSDSFVTTLYKDRQGNLWIGTSSGLVRFAGGKFRVELRPDGTPWDSINAIFEDREGNIWVGTIDGLCRLKKRQFSVYSKQEGLSYNDVMSVCEDRRGYLWICTWGGGLNQLKNGTVRVTGPHEGLFDQLLGICEDHDGNIWVGTDHGGGLFRITVGAANNPEGFPEVARDWSAFTATNGFNHLTVRVIHEDRQTNLWVSTGSSLMRFKEGKFTEYTEKDGLPSGVVQVVTQDQQGDVWVGTTKGLACFKHESFAPIANPLVSQPITALHADTDGTLWIGTFSGGLIRMNKASTPGQPRRSPMAAASWRFSSYTRQNGLFTDSICEILSDDLGNLWMSGRKGLFCVSKKNLEDFDLRRVRTITCTGYSQVDGGTSIIGHGIAKPSGCKARDGRLWFATAKGIVGFDPASLLNRDLTPPAIAIEEVLADTALVTSGAWRMTANSTSADAVARVVIPPGRRELEIHYTGLTFGAPDKMRFKYKLVGADPDWAEVTRRFASYNNLKPGDYVFQVVGCNSDGIWNDTGASLAITLLPHFWQTWWFTAAVILASLWLSAAVARWITKRRMQLKLQRLEQQHAIEKERARIAKDMHDDLGANLTHIGLLSELAQRQADNPEQVKHQTARIAETSRHLVQALDEIVWAVNPRNDNLSDFVSYVCQFAENFLEPCPIRFRLERPATIPEVPVSTDFRHNLFLVIKEALNNSVKHAQATEIWLRIKLGDGTMEISVEDNGRGFPPGETARFSDGLLNMKKRIDELGAQFEACSAPGTGTRIKCTIAIAERSTTSAVRPPPKG